MFCAFVLLVKCKNLDQNVITKRCNVTVSWVGKQLHMLTFHRPGAHIILPCRVYTVYFLVAVCTVYFLADVCTVYFLVAVCT